MEAAGAELGRDHVPRVGQLALPAAREDAGDPAAVRLEREVHARVGDDLDGVRLRQVPLDDPMAVDQVREVGGRRLAGEAEVPAGLLRPQDAAAVTHVAFLQYARFAAA
jgi:hypothetical protein